MSSRTEVENDTKMKTTPVWGDEMETCEDSAAEPPSSDQTTPSDPLWQEEETVPSLPVPPDGGWGWVVLAASFLCNAMVDGMASCFGVLMPHLAAYYGASSSKTALVGSIMIGSYLGAGPLVSAFVNYFGGRVSAMFGAGLASSALLISTLAPSINTLILTFGLIGGTGMCFFYIPAMVMVGYYFERRRAMAMGISSAGAGVGMLVFAPLTAYFLDIYDWKNTLVLLAGILMQVFILGALMRPLNLTKVRQLSNIESRDRLETLSDLDIEIVSEKDNNEDSDYQSGSEKSPEVGKNDDTDLKIHPSGNSNEALKVRKSNSEVNNMHPRTLHLLHRKLDELNREDQSTLTRSCDLGLLQSSVGMTYSPTMISPCAENYKMKKRQGQPSWVSCHELPGLHNRQENKHVAGRVRHLPESYSAILRRDVFYSGSIHALPEYKAQPDQLSYLTSMMNLPREEAGDPSGPTHSRPGICTTLRQMLDPSVCTNPSFIVLALGAVFIQLGYFIPIVYMTEYAATLGIDTGRSAILISVMGISNTVGRAGAGALANIPRVNALHLCNISLLITGGSTMLAVNVCHSFSALVCYSIVFGLSLAAFVPLTSIFLVQYIGLHRLTNTFGLLSLVRGIACMAGPPIAGAMLDATSSFHAVFYFAGSMFICAAIIQYFLPCTRKCGQSPDTASAHAQQ